MNIVIIIIICLLLASVALATRPLLRPELSMCQSRRAHFVHQGQNYLFSWIDQTAPKMDWIDARNFCRQRCMDATSIDSAGQWQALKRVIEPTLRSEMGDLSSREPEDRVPAIWTSGRLCDFDGCEKAEHFKPIHLKGWFWSSNNQRMSDTDCVSGQRRCFHEWSNHGKFGFPQPDSRELREEGLEGNESCLALLFNAYSSSSSSASANNHSAEAGLKWHDKACYHKMHFVCQDSKTLLRYARRKWRGTNIP